MEVFKLQLSWRPCWSSINFLVLYTEMKRLLYYLDNYLWDYARPSCCLEPFSKQVYFFKGCQYPGGSLSKWVHVTSLTCEANILSTKHLTHESILCIQITRGRVDFIGDSKVRSPCWHGRVNFCFQKGDRGWDGPGDRLQQGHLQPADQLEGLLAAWSVRYSQNLF